MIYCILGHGASGKTTIQNLLKTEIPAITTYTTRPMRNNEINGVHYHFLTNEKFQKKLEINFFVEHYYIPENAWYYGLSLHDIDYMNKNYTLVIEPNGYKKLTEQVDKKYLKCFYVHLSEHERIIRMAKRKDRIEEIFRRILSDRKDFQSFNDKADVILYSHDSIYNSNIILNHIKERAF